MVDLAVHAANAGNAQMWRFIAVDDALTQVAMRQAVDDAIDVMAAWPELAGKEKEIKALRVYATFFVDAPLTVAVCGLPVRVARRRDAGGARRGRPRARPAAPAAGPAEYRGGRPVAVYGRPRPRLRLVLDDGAGARPPPPSSRRSAWSHRHGSSRWCPSAAPPVRSGRRRDAPWRTCSSSAEAVRRLRGRLLRRPLLVLFPHCQVPAGPWRSPSVWWTRSATLASARRASVHSAARRFAQPQSPVRIARQRGSSRGRPDAQHRRPLRPRARRRGPGGARARGAALGRPGRRRGGVRGGARGPPPRLRRPRVPVRLHLLLHVLPQRVRVLLLPRRQPARARAIASRRTRSWPSATTWQAPASCCSTSRWARTRSSTTSRAIAGCSTWCRPCATAAVCRSWSRRAWCRTTCSSAGRARRRLVRALPGDAHARALRQPARAPAVRGARTRRASAARARRSARRGRHAHRHRRHGGRSRPSVATMRDAAWEQVRIMTFVPQAGTPLEDVVPAGDLDELLTIAVLRLACPQALIPASLDVDGIAGLERRLNAGASVVTSIVPPTRGLAGVSQSELDIEEGHRTVEGVLPHLARLGMRAGTVEEYRAWLAAAHERAQVTGVKLLVVGGKLQGTEAAYLAGKAGLGRRARGPAPGSARRRSGRAPRDAPTSPAPTSRPRVAGGLVRRRAAGLRGPRHAGVARTPASRPGACRCCSTWPPTASPSPRRPPASSSSASACRCRRRGRPAGSPPWSSRTSRPAATAWPWCATRSGLRRPWPRCAPPATGPSSRSTCAAPRSVVRSPGRRRPRRALQVTGLEFDAVYDCKRVVAPVGEAGRGERAGAGAGRRSHGVGPRRARRARWRASPPSPSASRWGLGLRGLMDVEVMVRDGEPLLLEIDARLPSQTPTAVYWSSGAQHPGGAVTRPWPTACCRRREVVPRARLRVPARARPRRAWRRSAGEHVMGSARAVASRSGVLRRRRGPHRLRARRP